MTENQNIRTWADAYGTWHASVPVLGTVADQEREARKAIRTELEARGAIGKGYRIRLALIGETQQCSPDRATYKEV